jgi:hypothetical protein
MSRIELEKRAERVRIVLEKRQLPDPPRARVGAALDVSGSAHPLYQRGIIQDTVSRLMAVSLRFDDNGELDGWAFDQRFKRLAEANSDNYASWVRDEIMNANFEKWGNTRYAPVMADIVDRYFGPGAKPRTPGMFGRLFGAKPTPVTPIDVTTPALNLFVTDGANMREDRPPAAKVMRDAQKHPLYWQLVGVGDPAEFGFLREMADELPNVGFLHLPSLDISDDDLYEQLLSEELCTWLKATAKR